MESMPSAAEYGATPSLADDPALGLSRRAKMEILVAVMLGLFLGALDQTIVGTALPRIVTDLGFETASFRTCGEGFLLTRAAMEWFRGHYLSDLAEIADPMASPLRAPDLGGLPPALVYTAGFDPLRDEGKAYADRLTAAGAKTIHREFDSLTHGFVGLRGTIHSAARAMDDMVAGLRHELAQLGR